MAFDGITIANIIAELNHTITGGKINKIAQPENDELIITIKNQRQQYRLFLSASASLPLIYLTDTNKPSPLHRSEFLYAAEKAYWQRADRLHHPAGNGTNHSFYYRTPERTGRSLHKIFDCGDYGKTQQYYLLQ